MSIVFPKNNLPEAAQPWAREIQSQLASIVEASTSDEINNAARDIQLNNSVLSLATVVNEVKATAQAASDAAAAASTASTQALSAAQAAQDAADAALAAQGTADNALGDAGDALAGLDDLGTSGSVYTISPGNLVSGGVRDGVLNLTSGANSSIQIFNGGVDINGPAAEVRVGISGNGGTQVIGEITFSGPMYAPGMTAATTNVSNVRRNTGTGAELTHTNESSARFKKDIVNLDTVEDLNPKKLLDIPVRAFKYKEDYPLSPNDSRYGKLIPGFIAEEVYEAYPIGADLNDEDHSLVQNWNERIIIPGMLALIQDLYKKIEILENKDKVE